MIFLHDVLATRLTGFFDFYGLLYRAPWSFLTMSFEI